MSQICFIMKKIAIVSRTLLFLSLLHFGLISCQKETTEPDPADPRANFLGGWSVYEQWTKLTYEVYITADPNSSSGIYIENFAGSGSGVKAHASISGSNVGISSLPQTLSNGWIIENGSGSMQGTTKINWSYVFNDHADTYTANAVYTKQ